ncbi:ubiquitin carboxyl-terminal hydrolase 4-like [Babylonia areolata]|uniref:ubiquitin carboxyl-terminal hydrolase 4-like n=1 Tax=Babylonia areolata TaxID=304850 RepID=UPI003FD075B9
MAEGGPSALEAQKIDIGTLLKKALKKGDTWFLLDIRWFKLWKKYVGYDSWDTVNIGDETYHPGPIDNSALFKEPSKDDNNSSDGTRLRDQLVDELDYVLLPSEAWHKMVEWFGIVDGQDPIERHVIEQGMFVKHCKVEVYLMDLKLCENSDISSVLTKQFSRSSTIEQLEATMKKIFNIDENKEVRLWNRYMINTYEHLSKKENTLQDAGLYQGQVIVVEQQNEDGSWPRHAKSTSTYNSNSTYATRYGTSGGSSYSNHDTSYGSSSSGSYYGKGYEKGLNAKPGLCGLANLGNTCFMNSALQCMSNVPSLTSYMLSGQWQEELNKENPLGMRGEIAVSFAELIREMWSGICNYTVPRNFKIAVGRFAPQFSGYQQQDSQELMAFLLDGLHEDLNRIRKKPYIELKDASGREDAVVAKEAWENYKKRNDSIIVDTFHGLLKSTVECPDCEKISVTFDPFCYLSLPMPIKKERQMEVFWVSASPADKLVQYKLTVPKAGCIMDLCKALSHYVDVPEERMVVTDVYNHRFHKIFGPEEGLSHILERDDIFIYEIPAATDGESEYWQIPVYFRELSRKRGSSRYTTSSDHLFGQPIILTVPRVCTYKTFYNTAPAPHLAVRAKRRKQEKCGVRRRRKKKGRMRKAICQKRIGVHPAPPLTDKYQQSQRGGARQRSGMRGHLVMNGDRPCQWRPDPSCEEDAASAPQMALKRALLTTWKQEQGDGRSQCAHFPVVICEQLWQFRLHVPTSDDEKPMKLNGRTFISADWSSLAKNKFYDEKIAEELEQHDTVRYRSAPKRTVLQLEDCLRLFTEAEQLSEQDPWYCPQCQKHQQATKKFDLWSLPQYLIIHLKRFSYNRYWRDKIDALVEFPTRGLDLRQYILNRENRDINIYDLIAVTNHYGGLGGGHYTAFAQNHDDGEWYYFDDSSVSSSSEESVVTKAAYVLVYKRRGQDSLIAKPSQAPPNTSGSSSTSSGDGSDVNGYTNSHTDDEMDVN